MTPSPTAILNDLLRLTGQFVHVYYLLWSPFRHRVSLNYDVVPELGPLDLSMFQQLLRRDWDDEAVVTRAGSRTNYNRAQVAYQRGLTAVNFTAQGEGIYISSPGLIEGLGPQPIKRQWARLTPRQALAQEVTPQKVYEGRRPGRPPRVEAGLPTDYPARAINSRSSRAAQATQPTDPDDDPYVYPPPGMDPRTQGPWLQWLKQWRGRYPGRKPEESRLDWEVRVKNT